MTVRGCWEENAKTYGMNWSYNSLTGGGNEYINVLLLPPLPSAKADKGDAGNVEKIAGIR